MPKSSSQRNAHSLQIKPSNRNTFIYKLYEILTEAYHDFLKWGPDGKRIIITDSSKLTSEVLSRYFQTEKLSSFIRQFHLYGFKRNSDGRKNKDKRGYVEWVHRYFQRGRYDYLQFIKRVSQPKGTLKGTPEHRPENSVPRPHFPIAGPSMPATFTSLSGHELPTNLAPANYAVGAPPAILDYPRLPPLAGEPPLSPTLPDIAGISLTLQPLPPPLYQPTLPVAADINMGQQMVDMLRQRSPQIHDEFETPQAQELMHALQLLYDNHGRVAPEVVAFVHEQLGSICQSIEGIGEGPLRERMIQAAPQPITINAKADIVPQNMQPPNMHRVEILAPRNAPSLPPANAVLAFGSANQHWNLPSSSGHTSLFSNSMSQRASGFHIPAPIITTPDNMAHLLAHQGICPRDHQELFAKASAGSKMSPATPHAPVVGSMSFASYTHQLSGASSTISMAADMFSAAPKSAGCHIAASLPNLGNVEGAYLPHATNMPQQLGGFSVADIYLQPALSFRSSPSIIDVTMGAPTPLFMNANSFIINSPSVTTPDPWASASISTNAAGDKPTLTPEQSQCNTPGLAPKSFE